MNRVLVVFSDGLLSELDSARGLVSRSAWIRQAVEDKLMKEAVAPLVPDFLVCNCGHPEALHRKNGAFAPCQIALCECQQFSKIRTFASRPPLTEGEWAAFQEGAGFETPEETEILDRMHGITPDWEALNEQQAEGLPAGIQDEEGNLLTVGQIADALEARKAKPKARRKKSVKVPDQPVSVMNRGGPASPTQEPSLPVRCHCKRGMIIGAGPRKGQCTVCGNPKPLKEPI